MLNRILPSLLAGALAGVPAAAETTLRIMSYNVWGGGGNEGKGIEETVAVLKAANADIIGMQETRLEPDDCTAESCAAVGASVAKAIAEALGYHYHDQSQEKAKGLKVVNAWIVGETGPRTDMAVDPWPSDHRATLAEIRF